MFMKILTGKERCMLYICYHMLLKQESPSWLQYAVLDTLFDEVHEDP